MRKNKIVSIVMIILLLPYVLAVFIKGEGAIWMIKSFEKGSVTVERDDKEIEIDWEEYMIGILAQEIPVEYTDAAMEAQAIMIQTRMCGKYNCKNIEELCNKDSIFREDYYTIEEIEHKWSSEDTVQIYGRLKEAVENTENHILMYGNEISKTPYHILSNGKTRDGYVLFPDDSVPYLVSVKCPLDLGNEKELTMSVIPYDELVEKLELNIDENKGNSHEKNERVEKNDASNGKTEVTYEDVGIEKKDESNYVLEVKVLDQIINGETFRTKLHLKSSCFSFQEDEDGLKITTEGIGHGIGLSQNTAHYMGLEGKSAEEILYYFYPGTSIKVEENTI